MTINDMLADLCPAEPTEKTGQKDRRPVTIHLPPEKKARWDRLQERTQRKFGKKAREMLLALIDAAEARMDKAS